MARNDCASSKEWNAAGATEQAAYRAGCDNACLIILDYMERHADYMKEIDEDRPAPPV